MIKFLKGILLFVFLSFSLYGQSNVPESYGFRHLRMIYKGDTVDILVKSLKGEGEKKKPLFFFCQGSLPIPLMITYDENGRQGIYSVFPFNPDSLSKDYHLAIISKPYVPLIVNRKSLNSDLTYNDSTGRYVKRNLLDYYVERDKAVIKFLFKQSWVSKDSLVVAGHSEGSAIAARLALTDNKVTALIYSGGSAMGRIMTIIGRNRMIETDSTREAEKDIENWEKIVADPKDMNGDNKVTYQFSIPPFKYLEKLKIPVFVTYGSKDACAPFNDYLRVEMIRQKRKNFTFKAYIGTEHNFFPLNKDGSINYDIFNWDKVAEDWRKWLRKL